MYVGYHFSTSSPTLIILHVFDYSHPRKSEVVSHCGIKQCFGRLDAEQGCAAAGSLCHLFYQKDVQQGRCLTFLIRPKFYFLIIEDTVERQREL